MIMKKEKQIANAKLGFMVLAGLVFLVFSLYMIGKNQNIFGTSFRIYADIENVNGLLPGNNVRFRGMDVGTVSAMDMLNEETIRVEMLIHKSKREFIKKNYQTSISTDGLMGNKVLQILVVEGSASVVEEGDVLLPATASGTDQILEKLETSGEYLEKSLINLAEITEKLNTNVVLWELLGDEELALSIKSAVGEFRAAGEAAKGMTKVGESMMKEFEAGEGLVSRLFTDTSMVNSLQVSLDAIQVSSLRAEAMVADLGQVVSNLEQGKGAVGMALNDSTFQSQVSETIVELMESAQKLNENLEALQHNFLFRRYFKKKAKEEENQEL